MDNSAISIELQGNSPAAHWAAEIGRALVTGRLHLAQSGDRELYDGLIRSVAAEIFADVPATPATNQAAERALSLVAAVVHLSVQLADGWAEADEMSHDEILSTLFAMLEEEGVTF
ncbi:MAG TPA: hypothetical protein VGR20_00890 [Acidimicrobiia bacterium]|jgi:hypothetical protein|nr:hypothetical protein [Acidimicrobiia bacterium]